MGLGGLFGGDEDSFQAPPPPEYYSDPNFNATQEFLKNYSENLLSGKPNAYYAPIGEIGGSEFEKFLALQNRDIQQSAAETAAQAGTARSGMLPNVTAQAVADNETKLRYADYLRALQGRAAFMDTGMAGEKFVGTQGFNKEQLKNNFDVNVYQQQSANALNEYNSKLQQEQEKGQAIGNLISTIGGGIAGGFLGGPMGAITGATGGISSIGSLSGMGIFDMMRTPTVKQETSTSYNPILSSFGGISTKPGSKILDKWLSMNT